MAKGYILISVLGILFLLTLLTTATIETTVQELKMTSNNNEAQQLFLAAENGMMRAEKQLGIKNLHYAQEGLEIQSTIKKIDEDYCAIVAGVVPAKHGIDYYRIVVKAINKETRYFIAIQSTYAQAKKEFAAAKCKNKKMLRLVHLGRQSWQQLEN